MKRYWGTLILLSFLSLPALATRYACLSSGASECARWAWGTDRPATERQSLRNCELHCEEPCTMKYCLKSGRQERWERKIHYGINVWGRGWSADKGECIRQAGSNYQSNLTAEQGRCRHYKGHLVVNDQRDWELKRESGWECVKWTSQACVSP